MASSAGLRIETALRRMTTSPHPGEILAIERSQTAGEPLLWKEVIRFEQGQLQSFTRIRSFVDEGGIPIGTWTTPAEVWRFQLLAESLYGAAIWARTSDETLVPGAELVSWTCVTSGGVFGVTVAASSPLLTELAELDLDLRRLANDIESSRQGASLRCALEVVQVEGQYEAHLSFLNDGNRPCLFVNPLAVEATDQDFLAIDIAPMPLDEPGVTSPEAEFESIPIRPVPTDLEPPWCDEYMPLMPGRPLVFPIPIPLDFPEPGFYVVRGVYSFYGNLNDIAGMPMIRGRAFSNELELNV